jgi:hypothetical protein
MFAIGTKRAFRRQQSISAFGVTADITIQRPRVAGRRQPRRYWRVPVFVPMWVSMLRSLLGVIAMAVALSLAQAAPSTPVEKKRDVTKYHVVRHWHGYGFLPGYRPPEVIERERLEHYYRVYGRQYYGPAWPGFYRGRWNGGGFGPCWTQTPIGPMWNCGR